MGNVTISSRAPNKRLRHARQQRCWSQEQVAEQLGTTPLTVGRWERGLTSPSLHFRQKLCALFEMSSAELGLVAEADELERPPLWIPPLHHQPEKSSPPASGPPARPNHNLPLPPSPLVGQQTLVAATTRRLHSDDTRLLTLCGPGGVGKTRLAIEIAMHLIEYFPDGVFFVALDAITDSRLVTEAITHTLEIHGIVPAQPAQPARPAQTPAEQVQIALRDRCVLLVLDNFEQVAPAATLVADILATCGGVKILVTSRSPLHLCGERQVYVRPLALPAADPFPPADELLRTPSVTFLLERLRAQAGDIALTADNIAAMAAICIQLDGLPLALELAAAWVKLLPLPALAERLTRRLPLLVGGARNLPPRQQTLHATLTWSYALLSPEEQFVFRSCAVFAGSTSLTAVEHILASTFPETPELDSPLADATTTLLTSLASLLEKNLLVREEDSTRDPSLRMLETIREYASDLLQASGQAEQAHAAHASYYAELAERAEPQLTGPDQQTWLATLTHEYENLRAALQWAGATDNRAVGLRLAGALWEFWQLQGFLGEGRRWLEAFIMPEHALTQATDPVFQQAHAKAISKAGALARRQGDYARAIELQQVSLALYRRLHDTRGIATALNLLGNVFLLRGDYAQALAHYEESLALRRQLDDRPGIASILNNLAIAVMRQADYPLAMAYFEESLTYRRALQDTQGIALTLCNLAQLALDQSDVALAEERSTESLELRRSLGDRCGIASSLIVLGHALAAQRQPTRAARAFRESLSLCRHMGLVPGVIACIEGVAVLVSRQAPARSVLLLGAAATLREAGHTPRPHGEHPDIDHTVTSLQAALPGKQFASSWATGAALPLEAATAMALEAADTLLEVSSN